MTYIDKYSEALRSVNLSRLLLLFLLLELAKVRTAISFFLRPWTVRSQIFLSTIQARSTNIYRQLTKFRSFFSYKQLLKCFPGFSLKIKWRTLFWSWYGIKMKICYSEHILNLQIGWYKFSALLLFLISKW